MKNFSFYTVLIPPKSFEVKKTFALDEIPYCDENETTSKHFIKKLEVFINICHAFCVTFRGKYSCDESYIGDTERNMKSTEKNQQDIWQTTSTAHLSGRYYCLLLK